MQKTEQSDRFLQLVQPCLWAEEEGQRRIAAFSPSGGKRKSGVCPDARTYADARMLPINIGIISSAYLLSEYSPEQMHQSYIKARSHNA